jgi:hypothetical protein
LLGSQAPDWADRPAAGDSIAVHFQIMAWPLVQDNGKAVVIKIAAANRLPGSARIGGHRAAADQAKTASGVTNTGFVSDSGSITFL